MRTDLEIIKNHKKITESDSGIIEFFDYPSAMKEAREEYAKEFAEWISGLIVSNYKSNGTWCIDQNKFKTSSELVSEFNAHLAAEAEKERGKG